MGDGMALRDRGRGRFSSLWTNPQGRGGGRAGSAREGMSSGACAAGGGGVWQNRIRWRGADGAYLSRDLYGDTGKGRAQGRQEGHRLW